MSVSIPIFLAKFSALCQAECGSNFCHGIILKAWLRMPWDLGFVRSQGRPPKTVVFTVALGGRVPKLNPSFSENGFILEEKQIFSLNYDLVLLRQACSIFGL